jgi:hypothetical protein
VLLIHELAVYTIGVGEEASLSKLFGLFFEALLVLDSEFLIFFHLGICDFLPIFSALFYNLGDREICILLEEFDPVFYCEEDIF